MPIKSMCLEEIERLIETKIVAKVMMHEKSFHEKDISYNVEDFDVVRRKIETQKHNLQSCLRELVEKK